MHLLAAVLSRALVQGSCHPDLQALREWGAVLCSPTFCLEIPDRALAGWQIPGLQAPNTWRQGCQSATLAKAQGKLGEYPEGVFPFLFTLFQFLLDVTCICDSQAHKYRPNGLCSYRVTLVSARTSPCTVINSELIRNPYGATPDLYP